MKLKVEFRQTRTGDVIVRIVNKRVVAKVRKYLNTLEDCRQLGDGLSWPFDGTIYFHENTNLYWFNMGLLIHCNFESEDVQELQSGWLVTKLVDSWIVLNMVGYSACDNLKL